MSIHRRTDLVDIVDATDHIRGPIHAPITLLEYGDFECPGCKQASGALKIMLARFPEQVRLVFRHYPLESSHPHALMSAQAAEAAAAQGRFWQMHDLLFANQRHLETKRLHGYARDLGLDMARFVAEMDDAVYLQRVREHIDSGKRSGVRATPAFFVNGVIKDVSFGMAGLFDAVEHEVESNVPYASGYRICPVSRRFENGY
ncbi:DsbA family protein [Povalibacter sp.]|uniref:DsbA family protein n=1 Tax=Povalibacter sp. TaxID=1962978 RepID=UPI002F42EE21